MRFDLLPVPKKFNIVPTGLDGRISLFFLKQVKGIRRFLCIIFLEGGLLRHPEEFLPAVHRPNSGALRGWICMLSCWKLDTSRIREEM